MSILETSLRERMKLLEQQADQYAGAVDTLSNRLAEALRRLAPHDPDYVRGEAPGLVGHQPEEFTVSSNQAAAEAAA